MSDEQRKLVEEELLKDMQEFLSITNASPKSLASHYWSNTPYSAMEGFGEILLEYMRE